MSKTWKDVSGEWWELAQGYPGEDFRTRARRVFDVLAPFDVEVGRRYPLYEHATGPADVEEIWALALKIEESIDG